MLVLKIGGLGGVKEDFIEIVLKVEICKRIIYDYVWLRVEI